MASSQGFTDTQDNQKGFDRKYYDKDPGPYFGVVKETVDPLKMGRLGVNIPALTNTTNPKASQLIWCQYLSPFYGVSPLAGNSKTDPFNDRETQHSYGFWAIPPDIDTEVLVIFAQGERNQSNAFWIGCVQQPLTNQQVPAHGATENTSVATSGGDFDVGKEQLYGTELLPASEKNQLTSRDGETLASVDGWKHPINVPLADQMKSQGLVQDEIRGPITSSARRESPSQVFGISTPGTLRTDTRTVNIGVDKEPVEIDRLPGHSFVMDDGDENGESQLTRIRTASGHQILLHDTDKSVYISNGTGKSWIEMTGEGKFRLYATEGIDIRTSGDMNLHSDADINFHARENIKFTAEKNLALNAENYVYTMGAKGVLTSSQEGAVRHYAKSGISSFTKGTQLHGASGRIDLAGSQVHFNSIGARAVWGPGWLKPDHKKVGITVKDGMIDIDPSEPFTTEEGELFTNETENRTTVTGEFVTHEPMDRKVDVPIEKIDVSDMLSTYDPYYKPPIGYTTSAGRFDNEWLEMIWYWGPNFDGVNTQGRTDGTVGGSLNTSAPNNEDNRSRYLLAKYKIITPFMDRNKETGKLGKGNVKQKKAEFDRELINRQKRYKKYGYDYDTAYIDIDHDDSKFPNAVVEWEAYVNGVGTYSPNNISDERFRILSQRLGATANRGVYNILQVERKFYRQLDQKKNS
jgi:hypothetical protein